MLIVTLNLDNLGGIERESKDAYSFFLNNYKNVKLLSPKRFYRGFKKDFIARVFFILRLYISLFRHKNIIIMHAKLIKPVYLLSKFSFKRHKIICWIHGIEVWGREYNSVKNHLIKVDGFLSDSSNTVETMIKKNFPKEIFKVVNPMSSLIDETIKPIYEKNEVFSLLTVSRIDRSENYKGHDLIVSALDLLINKKKLVKNIEWNIVGSGDGMEELIKLIYKYKLESYITILGSISDEQLKNIFLKCSVFIMPSNFGLKENGFATGEGFGIAYLEAAFAAKPSIACKLGGQTDIIKDKKNGILVDPSPKSVSEAIYSYYKSYDLIQCHGKEARLTAENKFSKKIFQENLLNSMKYFNIFE